MAPLLLAALGGTTPFAVPPCRTLRNLDAPKPFLIVIIDYQYFAAASSGQTRMGGRGDTRAACLLRKDSSEI
jgi:hypothetical protein